MFTELKQTESTVANGEVVNEDATFASGEDGPFSMEQYIDYNFKFWGVCERGGHDFIERANNLPPQCAVCGTLLTQGYKDEMAKYSMRKDVVALYGGAGWSVPIVKKSRAALRRLGDAPTSPSTITTAGQSSETHNQEFQMWCKAEEGPSFSLISACWFLWPFFYIIPHKHCWRPCTSKNDYGRHGSKRWGNYSGRREAECLLCGAEEIWDNVKPR